MSIVARDDSGIDVRRRSYIGILPQQRALTDSPLAYDGEDHEFRNVAGKVVFEHAQLLSAANEILSAMPITNDFPGLRSAVHL
jgi:hypothetical protein